MENEEQEIIINDELIKNFAMEIVKLEQENLDSQKPKIIKEKIIEKIKGLIK